MKKNSFNHDLFLLIMSNTGNCFVYSIRITIILPRFCFLFLLLFFNLQVINYQFCSTENKSTALPSRSSQSSEEKTGSGTGNSEQTRWWERHQKSPAFGPLHRSSHIKAHRHILSEIELAILLQQSCSQPCN